MFDGFINRLRGNSGVVEMLVKNNMIKMLCGYVGSWLNQIEGSCLTLGLTRPFHVIY